MGPVTHLAHGMANHLKILKYKLANVDIELHIKTTFLGVPMRSSLLLGLGMGPYGSVA